MKTSISKFISVLILSALVLSLSACGASKGYKAKANDTWGDLCRQFEPEWYDSLSEEVKAQYDEILLSEDPSPSNDEPSLSSVVPVYKVDDEENTDSGYTVFARDYSNMTGKNDFPTDLNLMINEQDKILDYMASVASSFEEVPVDFTLVVALSDSKTGEYLSVDTKSISVTKDIDGIAESIPDLKQGHKYKFQAIAIVDPPEGYEIDGPMYVEKEVTAAEPKQEDK